MENRQFAEGYREPANHIRHNNDTQEVNELMDGPRKMASFFDRQLIMYLKGAPADEPEELLKELTSYKDDWADVFLGTTIDASRQLAMRNPEADPTINELNFHLLTRELMPMWHLILLPEFQKTLTPDDITTMQTSLAYVGAELAFGLNYLRNIEKTTGVRSNIATSIVGQQSEVDAAIVLLEVVKDDARSSSPTLALVAAPPRFESGHRNSHKAADLILIDTELNVSRGYQVKTYIDGFSEGQECNDDEKEKRYKPIHKYDDNYVTLIDGMIDLGNSRLGYVEGIGPTQVPNPGQIALNYLKFDMSFEKTRSNPAFKGQLKYLIRGREIAKKLSNQGSSYLSVAKENIKHRVLYDLYK